jgi:uncharacterized protein YozE (UPF0346 family)
MRNTLSAAQIEQLRRDARRLSKRESIPLHEAQSRLAIERGFGNWSQLVKQNTQGDAARGPSAPARTNTPALLPRYYLHGDESETEPSKFYCAQCDTFEEAPHFEAEHELESVVYRYERNMSYWRGPDNTSKLRFSRPDAAINVLEPLVRAFKENEEAQQKLNSAFYRWLGTKIKRNGPIGDLADDAVSDKNFPRREASVEKLVAYLQSRRASREAIATLRRAHKSFEKSATKSGE